MVDTTASGKAREEKEYARYRDLCPADPLSEGICGGYRIQIAGERGLVKLYCIMHHGPRDTAANSSTVSFLATYLNTV